MLVEGGAYGTDARLLTAPGQTVVVIGHRMHRRRVHRRSKMLPGEGLDWDRRAISPRIVVARAASVSLAHLDPGCFKSLVQIVAQRRC